MPMTMTNVEALAKSEQLMEKICDVVNLNQAYKRVKANKGAAGVDGVSVNELYNYLQEHKEAIIKQLLDGSYKPKLVRGVKIPKPGGGERQLGIPTTVDRLIQQAILQVLEPMFESGFSDSSYGFRPKRSAHQALQRAGAYVAKGNCIVVDIDIAQFFDRVNHDILMSRLARKIRDKRLLKIIRGYLTAGLMQDGLCIRREVGTPQGGPLSPLLSNILLDELDKELDRRGHKYVRYADDCNIYVKSIKAGERVLSSLKDFLWKRLKLKINDEKSAVALSAERKFLGYTVKNDGQLKIAKQTIMRMKKKVRELTSRNRGRSLEKVIQEANQYLCGWINYFKLSVSKSTPRELDSWIRRRLRCYRLKQRKCSWPIAKLLMQLGVARHNAWKLAKSSKGWWRLSHNPTIDMAMPNKWFEGLGLFSLSAAHLRLNT